MNLRLRPSFVCLAVTFVATLLCGAALFGSRAYRAALEYAGDTPLPGSGLRWDPARIDKLIARLGEEGRAAYSEFLGFDYGFVAILTLFFLSMAWTLRHLAEMGAGCGCACVLYTIADCAENSLLREMLSGSTWFAGWAAAATSAKWILFGAAAVAGVLGLLRLMGSRRAWWEAFFQDVPFILDSLWRRNEFMANREFLALAGSGGTASGHARAHVLA